MPDGEARRRVHSAIRDEPGIHKSELARRLGLAPTTISHHVGKLESLGLVRAIPRGRVRHLVATDQPLEKADFLLAPEAKAALRFILRGGVHSPREIQQAMGLGEKAVRRALRRLEEARLVRSDGAYHPRYWAPGELEGKAASGRTSGGARD